MSPYIIDSSTGCFKYQKPIQNMCIFICIIYRDGTELSWKITVSQRNNTLPKVFPLQEKFSLYLGDG
jgi:hypothetical protein